MERQAGEWEKGGGGAKAFKDDFSSCPVYLRTLVYL